MVVNQDLRTVSAVDLLRGFVELRIMAPYFELWTEKTFRDNPPRLIRLRRLRALFRAYHVPWHLEEFVSGAFLDPDDPRYADLLAAMESTLTAKVGKAARAPRAVWRDLPSLFERLLRYRESLERSLCFSDGVLLASGLSAYAHNTAGEMNRVITDNLAIVEGPLAACISPAAKVFSIDQMALEFGYPAVDLGAIDVKWF